MLKRLIRTSLFQFRTPVQSIFIQSLKSMQMNYDQEVIEHVRNVYNHREYLQNCEEVQIFIDRIETYLLNKQNCTVAHLQCYYKLKQMLLVTAPFKHNMHRKYLNFVQDQSKNIKNQHLEKYLWFLFDEGRYERTLFEEAASNHILKLHQIYQYMSELNDLPTWEPYIRVGSMLKYLGHEIKGHKLLGAKRTIERIQHRYLPLIPDFFTLEEMQQLQEIYQYDDPFVTTLCSQFFLKNTSRYDSYLQRIERVELEKSYERHLQIMSWNEIVPIIDLLIKNHEIAGPHEDLENQLNQLFFRLCQHSDIDIQTITDILDRFFSHPNFMFFKRGSLLARTIDAIANKNLQDFSHFPTDGYIKLLQTTPIMSIGKQAVKALQEFLCKKVQSKLIWNEGEIQRFKEVLQSGQFEGSSQLQSYLSSLQKQR